MHSISNYFIPSTLLNPSPNIANFTDSENVFLLAPIYLNPSVNFRRNSRTTLSYLLHTSPNNLIPLKSPRLNYSLSSVVCLTVFNLTDREIIQGISLLAQLNM